MLPYVSNPGTLSGMTALFENDLNRSQEDTLGFPLKECLKQLFPDYLFHHKASTRLDRDGADLVIHLRSGIRYADLKIRDDDPRLWGSDDLAIELYSVLENGIRGYRNRKTDYLIWVFKPTRRCALIPFDTFIRCYEKNWDFWHFWRAEPPQRTRMNDGVEYHSVHCYVPFELFAKGAKEASAHGNRAKAGVQPRPLPFSKGPALSAAASLGRN